LSSEPEVSLFEAAARTGTTVAARREPVSRFLDVQGLNLHHLDWGSDDKPPMLCIHGSAQNAHMWDFTALAFCDRYHIVAIDQRGHGDSEWASDHNYSPDAYLGDITGIVDALGFSSPILMGLSMGGRSAIAYTAANPNAVRALIVVDVGPESSSRGEGAVSSFVTQSDVLDSFEQFVARVIEYSPLRPEWQIRSSLRHSLRQLSDGRWTWKYDSFLRDPARRSRQAETRQDPAARWKLWEGVQCPALLVRGERSNMLDADDAARMIERNSNSELVEIPDAGHRVPGDNPVDFERAVREFLAGLNE
jgi:pimeloyl-ACP methyl ester carboxylesterase